MQMLQPNESRAKAAVAMIYVVGALDVVSLASSFFQYQLLERASAGETILIEAATANDTRQQVVGIIYLLAFIVSAIVFIMWFRRAYNNLHQKTLFLTYGEGWAAGSWFVPILNLFRPYQIMKEMYERTKELFEKRQVIHVHKLETTLLGWWWFLWILSSVSGQIEYRMAKYATSIPALKEITVFGMVDNVLGIILAWVAAIVVKNYAAAEVSLEALPDEAVETAVSADLL